MQRCSSILKKGELLVKVGRVCVLCPKDLTASMLPISN
jgi:hypothetical protein